MRILNSMAISSTGLTAERLRMDLISSNIANINTTKTKEGGPYKRKVALFAEKLDKTISNNQQSSGKGVEVVGIKKDDAPDRLVYNPNHPDADNKGYVHYANINVVTEMVDMLAASRSYEANITAINASKNMALKALEIGRG